MWLEVYERIMAVMPNGWQTECIWVVSPYVIGLLGGILAYFHRHIPSVACMGYTVFYFFVFILESVIDAQEKTNIAPGVLGLVDIVPILLLAMGIMIISYAQTSLDKIKHSSNSGASGEVKE